MSGDVGASISAHWQYTPYLVPLLTAGILSLALAYFSWQRRPAPGAVLLSLLMVAIAEYFVGYALELAHTDVAHKILLAKVEYIAAVSVPAVWFALVLEFTGRARWLTRRTISLLAVEPIITLFLVATNESHHLVWASMRLDTSGSHPTLTSGYGPWFWVHSAYSYTLILFGCGLLAKALLRSPKLYRLQIGALLGGVLLSLAGNALFVFRLLPAPYLDPTPFAFTLTSVVLGWGLFRWHLFDLVPVAHEVIVENMREGIIVLDAYNRIVNLNSASRHILGPISADALGKPVSVLANWHPLFAHFPRGQEMRTEILRRNGTTRYYEVSIIPLTDNHVRLPGHLITLHDTTQRRRELEARNRRAERSHRQHEALVRLATLQPLAQGDLAEALPVIAAEAARALDIAGVSIWRFAPGPEELRCLAHFEQGSLPPPPHKAVPCSAFPRFWAVLKEGQVISAVDVRTDERTRELEACCWGPRDVRSTICAPIRLHGQVVGVVCHEHVGAPRAWHTDEVTFAGRVADLVAQAFLHGEVRQRAEQLAALHTTLVDITAQHDLPTLLQDIMERATRLLQGTGGGLYLTDPERQVVRCVVSYNTSRDRAGVELKYGEGTAGTVAQTGKPLVVDDDRTWDTPASVYGGGRRFSAGLSVPMIWQGHVTGVIRVLNSAERRHFTPEDLELLTLFANQAAIAVENARLLNQVQEQAYRVRQILDTVPDGVALLDTGGRIMLANAPAQEYLALLASARVGDRLSHLGECPLEALLVPPPPDATAHQVITTSEPQRTFEVVVQPMVHLNDVENLPHTSGWVLVMRDVTRERQIQSCIQQHERLAAIGQLAAGIAHDFNNILQGIIGFADRLARRPDMPQDARERLRLISEQGQRGAHLVRQILDFSRQSVPRRRPTDLSAFLQEAGAFLDHLLPEMVHVRLDIQPGRHIINADPAQLQQVLTNLATNARDAMPQGGELTIALRRMTLAPGEVPPLPTMQPGHWIVLSISDTGIGIPAKALPHIFEPFFTTKAVGKGTGLGLAQAYGIIQQHEGHIDVTSQVGRGTTFTLYFPAYKVLPHADASAPKETRTMGHGETILVVEDDPQVLVIVQQMLEDLGYRVLTARNGRDAVRLYREHCAEVGLVLTDLIMPEMSGTDLAQELRVRVADIPVVVMTGYPTQVNTPANPAPHIAAVLPKPFTSEELAHTLRDVLSRCLAHVADEST